MFCRARGQARMNAYSRTFSAVKWLNVQQHGCPWHDEDNRYRINDFRNSDMELIIQLANGKTIIKTLNYTTPPPTTTL